MAGFWKKSCAFAFCQRKSLDVDLVAEDVRQFLRLEIIYLRFTGKLATKTNKSNPIIIYTQYNMY